MAAFHDLVRGLAGDYQKEASLALSDTYIDSIADRLTYTVGEGGDAVLTVNALDVALEYCRAAEMRDPDAYPEYARALPRRIAYLESLQFSPEASEYVVSGQARDSMAQLPYATATEFDALQMQVQTLMRMPGPAGLPGEDGDNGYTPSIRVVSDGARRVLQIYNYDESDGREPTVQPYLGAGFQTSDINDAVDIRGPQGIQGVQGVAGSGVEVVQVVNYEPSPALQASAGQFVEFPAAAAFTKALTADDDDSFLHVEINIANASGGDSTPTFASKAIRVGFFRDLAMTSAGTAVSGTSGITFSDFLGDSNNWNRVVLGKGANGRFGITPTGACYVGAFRAYLVENAEGGGGTGGLTQAQVDSRVRSLLETWALLGNADTIPDAKMPATIARTVNVPTLSIIDDRVANEVESWALDGNTDRIPDAKIPTTIPRAADVGLNQSQVDARVRANVLDWAEQGNADDIPDAKIAASIARTAQTYPTSEHRTMVFDSFSGGRWADRTETYVATTIQAARPTLAEAQGFSYAASFTRGTAADGEYATFAIPVGVQIGDLDHWRLRVGEVQADDRDFFQVFAAEDRLGADSSLQYITVRLNTKPAGEGVYLQNRVNYQLNPELVDVIPTDGTVTTEKIVDGAVTSAKLASGISFTLEDGDVTTEKIAANAVTPAKIAVSPDSRVAGRFLKWNDDLSAIDSERLLSSSEVWDGSFTPVTVALNANSAVRTEAFDEVVDLGIVGHGLLEVSLTLSMTARANNSIGFSPAGAESIRVSGSISIEELAGTSPGTQGGSVVIQQDVYRNASTITGVVEVRLAHDARNQVGLNMRYIADGGTVSTLTFGLNASGIVALLETGAARRPQGTSGAIYEYEMTLPTADEGIPDGTLAIVWSGDAKGLYRKGSTTKHTPADTGLAGLTVATSGMDRNIKETADGRYTHESWGRIAFSNRGTTNITPNPSTGAGSWADAPSVLQWLDFNYRTATRADGELRIVFTTGRTYTGDIVLSAGGSDFEIQRQVPSTSIWALTGLSGPQVTALRENDWTFSEPGVQATTTTHEWIRISESPASGSARGGLIATNVITTASPYSPTGADDRLGSWVIESERPGTGNITRGSGGTSLNMDGYVPSSRALGYLIEASRDGSVRNRAFMGLGPSGITNEREENEPTDQADIALATIALGPGINNRSPGFFIRARYRALFNGRERLAILPYPTRVRRSGLLMDYDPSGGDRPTFTSNAAVQLPAAAVFSRSLTSADDDAMLFFELTLAGHPPTTGMANAGFFRALANNGEALTLSARASGGDREQTITVAKGANGRLAFQTSSNTTNTVERVRIWLTGLVPYPDQWASIPANVTVRVYEAVV